MRMTRNLEAGEIWFVQLIDGPGKRGAWAPDVLVREVIDACWVLVINLIASGAYLISARGRFNAKP